jgi:thiamine biosynthesis protein ThiC
MRILGIVALGAALGGCASSSSDITPTYVSPVTYQSFTCQQLGLEAQSISARAAALSGAQDSQRTKDAVATTATVIIFWPAAFLVGGDKQTAAELAQMKGQMVAVEQASIAKNCGIQFQGPRPPGT